MWIHGGGLTEGSRSIPAKLKNQGFAVATIDYRLSPGAKSPAYVEDAAAAVAWIFNNIEKYGGSPDRIFLTGHSAGGYLAMMLDLDNLRNSTRDGLHAAALGAVWQMAIPGFMGMRVREDHIYFQPALPEAWKQIRFPLQYRVWRLEIAAGAGSYRVEVSGSGQAGAVMKIGDSSHPLTAGEIIEGTCRL